MKCSKVKEAFIPIELVIETEEEYKSLLNFLSLVANMQGLPDGFSDGAASVIRLLRDEV